MWKKERKVKIFIVLFIIIYYLPTYWTKMYISSDEFSAIAVPAILSGVDWRETVALNSYHGIGYTILMTPLFLFCKNYVLAHAVIILYGISVKIISAELLYDIFENYFNVDIILACVMSLMYACGPTSGDSYGISALSEAPIALCLIVAIWSYFKYKKKNSSKWLFLAIGSILYTYTIHSRSLIILLSTLIILVVYAIREGGGKKKLFLAIVFSILLLVVLKFGVKEIQCIIFDIKKPTELINDPSMVMESSAYQLKKLLKIDSLVLSLQICASLIFSQSMLVLGIGAVSLATCIYTVIYTFFNKEKIDGTIQYISLFALLCILGMNLGIGIQAVGRIEEGNYSWLTYTRYAEPFWVLAYIIFVYYLNQRKSYGIRIIWGGSIICEVICVEKYLVNMLTDYGLKNSVINRIFYCNQSIEKYLFLFCKMGVLIIGLFIIFCNKKIFMNLLIFTIAIGLVMINYQYVNYYVDKEKVEYASVSSTAEVITELKNEFSDIKIYADSENVVYSNKLQYVLYDTVSLKYLGENEKVNSSFVYVNDYMDKSNKYDYIVKLAENQYIATSNKKIYSKIVELNKENR